MGYLILEWRKIPLREKTILFYNIDLKLEIIIKLFIWYFVEDPGIMVFNENVKIRGSKEGDGRSYTEVKKGMEKLKE